MHIITTLLYFIKSRHDCYHDILLQQYHYFICCSAGIYYYLLASLASAIIYVVAVAISFAVLLYCICHLGLLLLLLSFSSNERPASIVRRAFCVKRPNVERLTNNSLQLLRRTIAADVHKK